MVQDCGKVQNSFVDAEVLVLVTQPRKTTCSLSRPEASPILQFLLILQDAISSFNRHIRLNFRAFLSNRAVPFASHRPWLQMAHDSAGSRPMAWTIAIRAVDQALPVWKALSTPKVELLAHTHDEPLMSVDDYVFTSAA